ncbi:MAG: sigma-70 family RNA polymerase sigma factor [Anaerolineaceae bacterium]|nr:MAG: sigma-70 family RNA polymerase sigma factor [Anaerolineaceae bacterium]
MNTIQAETLTLPYNRNMDKRTNEEWVADLRAGGDQQAQALEDLRAIILRGLPYAIAGRIAPNSPESEALTEEVVQETLMRVLEYLDTFEGRSQFTTWAHKIAVRAALTELRRVRWREVPLPEMEMNDEGDASYRELPDSQASPEEQVSRAEMMKRVNRIIMEELTEKQRMAMTAIMEGFPLEEAAQRLGTNRNTLYKLMHDARLRLKKRLEKEGLTPREVLSVFEQSGK